MRFLTGSCWLFAAGCAQLPNLGNAMQAHGATSVQIEGARGPHSTQRVETILAELRGTGDEADVLQQHIAVEQAIVGTPLMGGNEVILLQDGAATYRAMFAAIGTATDHINLESYIIEDDEIGRQLADLLLAALRETPHQRDITASNFSEFTPPKKNGRAVPRPSASHACC